MRILPTIVTIWWDQARPANPCWTSHISYETVASLLRRSAVWAVHSTTAEYNGPLEAAIVCIDAHIDHDRYDFAVCVATDQPILDLSSLLRDCILRFLVLHFVECFCACIVLPSSILIFYPSLY